MSRSAVQFQKGLSLPEFQRLYGTEEQCEAAPVAATPTWIRRTAPATLIKAPPSDHDACHAV